MFDQILKNKQMSLSGPNGTPFTEVYEENDCTICILPIAKVATNPCHHKFHKKCLGEWMTISDKCPTCQVELGSQTAALNPVLYTQQDEAEINNMYDNIGRVIKEQIYASQQDSTSKIPSPPNFPPPNARPPGQPRRTRKRKSVVWEARMASLPDNDSDPF